MKKMILGLFLMVAAMLSACGDDGSSSSSDIWPGSNSAECVVTEENTCELPECNEKIVGKEIVVTYNDIWRAYYCTKNGWVTPYDKNESIPSGFLIDDDAFGVLNDPRDGQKYKTIVVGNQEWMAENLNYSDSVQTPVLKGQTVCGEDRESTGCYYGWPAALDACPEGWHLPSKEEWDTLISVDRGLVTSWGWGRGCWLYSDSSDFSLMPAVKSRPLDDTEDVGDKTSFWSATDDQFYRICCTYILWSEDVGYDDGNARLSVRCLKNGES